MRNELRISILVPIGKKKLIFKFVQSSNYRGIKLMNHDMKLLKRVIE